MNRVELESTDPTASMTPLVAYIVFLPAGSGKRAATHPGPTPFERQLKRVVLRDVGEHWLIPQALEQLRSLLKDSRGWRSEYSR
jgi:hypothetical protein